MGWFCCVGWLRLSRFGSWMKNYGSIGLVINMSVCSFHWWYLRFGLCWLQKPYQLVTFFCYWMIWPVLACCFAVYLSADTWCVHLPNDVPSLLFWSLPFCLSGACIMVDRVRGRFLFGYYDTPVVNLFGYSLFAVRHLRLFLCLWWLYPNLPTLLHFTFARFGVMLQVSKLPLSLRTLSALSICRNRFPFCSCWMWSLLRLRLILKVIFVELLL